MAAGYDPEAAASRRRSTALPARLAVALALAASGSPPASADPPRTRIAAVPAGCFAGRPAPAPTGLLDEAGEIALEDGGSARLAGLAPPAPDDPRWRAALSAALAGPDMQARMAGAADRWSRQPVEIVAGGIHVAARLASEGAAYVLPGELPPACTRALLAREREARQAGRGLWAGGPADAADGPAMARLAGRYVVATGRVTGLGQSTARVYLNFGTIRGQSFAATIAKRALQKVEASGMRWTSLEGRFVAVRGVVSEAGGPRIEITSPDQIESLDPAASP
jgi:hypothetical protein